MVDVSEVGDRIYMIDDRLFSIPKWGSVYVIDEDKKALVDAGPATSAAVVLEGLRQTGIGPDEISYIIATHVHLDHTGGIGVLVRQMPQAQVLVHRRGARHLIDPARLLQGAADARGSEIIEAQGEVLPVEEQRVRVVNDGDAIALSGTQTLTFLDTPGHAPHELCILETRGRGLFTGDAIAAYIPDCDILLPYHPPPDFDLPVMLVTFERLRSLSASRVYYAHFGFTDRVEEHLDRAREKMGVWDRIVREAVAEGAFEDARARLIEHGRTEVEPMRSVPALAQLHDHIVKVHLPLAADGHMWYYRKMLKPAG